MVQPVGGEKQRQGGVREHASAAQANATGEDLAEQHAERSVRGLAGEHHPVARVAERSGQQGGLGGGPGAVQPFEDDEAPSPPHLGSSEAGSSSRRVCRTSFNDW